MEDWREELSDMARAGCRCEECNEERRVKRSGAGQLDALAEGFGSPTGPEPADEDAAEDREEIEDLLRQREMLLNEREGDRQKIRDLRRKVEEMMTELRRWSRGEMAIGFEALLDRLTEIFGGK